MNRIAAMRISSKLVPEGYLTIAVDGEPIETLIEQDGLVSSLLGWFHHDEDCAVPWKRIMPEPGCTAYCPILICPDDLDLSCSVVIAEIVAESDTIRWDRFGFSAAPAEIVGAIVRWDLRGGPFRFRRAEYETCVNKFRSNHKS